MGNHGNLLSVDMVGRAGEYSPVGESGLVGSYKLEGLWSAILLRRALARKISRGVGLRCGK